MQSQTVPDAEILNPLITSEIGLSAIATNSYSL